MRHYQWIYYGRLVVVKDHLSKSWQWQLDKDSSYCVSGINMHQGQWLMCPTDDGASLAPALDISLSLLSSSLPIACQIASQTRKHQPDSAGHCSRCHRGNDCDASTSSLMATATSREFRMQKSPPFCL